MLQRTSTYLGAPLILAFLLLAHIGLFVWLFAVQSPPVDFFISWRISQSVSRHPASNIYSPDTQRDMGAAAVADAQSLGASPLQRQTTSLVMEHDEGRMDAVGTPFLYAIVGWLSTRNFTTAHRRFVILSLSCLVASMLLLKKLLRFSIVEIALLMIFVAADYAPVVSDMRVANVNDIQLLAIVLFIFLSARARPLLAGLALGAATMFKPTTAIILALAVIAALADREYRQLVRLLSGCLLAVVASLVSSIIYFSNPAIWLEFLRSLPKTLSGASHPLEAGNFSLSALFGTTRVGSVAISVVLFVAYTWLFIATGPNVDGPARAGYPDGRTDRRRTHTAFAVGGGGCAMMLLSSPLVWLHYYMLLLPLSLYVIRPLPARRTASATSGIHNTLGLLAPFLLLFMFSFLVEITLGVHVHVLCAALILATLSTLMLASYHIWKERRCHNSADALVIGQNAVICK